jgi:DNA polymerase-3 subunit beta
MKASYDREGLLAAFQLASTVVPTRSPKPILQNVKIVATQDGGRDQSILMATDLDVGGVRLEVIGVKVEEPGEALLPTARFGSILRESTDKDLDLTADATSCLVQGQSSEFELPSDDPAQYPDVPTFEETDYHEVQAGQLREMIARTVFATVADNTRFALGGLLFELENDRLKLISTDSKRLAVTQGPAVMHGNHGTTGQTAVVPTKAMLLLERTLTSPDEQVRVVIRSNEALFRTSRALIYSRLVEGRFPPYREVFPKKINAKIPLTVGTFLTAVKQAAILTDEDSKGVDFTFGKNKLTLKARVADRGRAKVEMPIEYEGKSIDITFQPKYLIDMLRVLDEDQSITLELTDGMNAGLFRAGDEYSYIVMPITVKESKTEARNPKSETNPKSQ